MTHVPNFQTLFLAAALCFLASVLGKVAADIHNQEATTAAEMGVK